MSGGEFEIEERIPCPDGNCVGIIRDDGRCGTCGRAESGETATEPNAAAQRDANGAPEDRVPCKDGRCTGIVAPDGRCGTCGVAQ